jgi:predicted ATP-grasp superfamily ATP-dependent carboligase
MSTALILDAEIRSSLAVIRSLGRKGIKVSAASSSLFAMGALSKYCQKRYILPNSRNNATGFLNSLIKILKRKSYDCVFASHTYTAYLLALNQKELSLYTRVPTPPLKVFEIAYHKEKTLQYARKNNISVPRIYNIEEVHNGEISYPVIIKSLRRHGMGIHICKSTSELQSHMKKMSKTHEPFIIQDYIPNGGEIGVYALFNNNSQPRVAIMQRRIRTCYPYGGASTLRETIKDDNLMKRSLDFLKQLQWIGVAMVEFRIDKRDKTVNLLEINPRFWGSLELSIHAGIDFPFLLYQMVMEGDIKSVFAYNEGVQTRWFFGDVRQLFLNFGTYDNTNFFSLKTHDDVIQKDDLLPAIYGSFSIITRN